MQQKSEPREPVTAEGKKFQDFMLPVNSPELKKLLLSKYSERKPRNRVQLDDIIKDREDKEIENSRKASLLFIALAALLLIGIGLLPKSPVPVLVPRMTVTSVSMPEPIPIPESTSASASASASTSTTQLFTVKETYTTKSP